MEPEKPDAVARKEIWSAAYETLYDSGYNELFSEKLLSRWQLFDDLTRVLVAVTTTSSSAAAGLAIWSWPVFKQVWASLAALGILLSIISSSLRSPTRLKAWAASKQEFGTLYIELETFMFNMRIDKKASIPELKREFNKWRTRYVQAKQRIPLDRLVTEKIANSSQEAMDIRIRRSILYQSNGTRNQ
ncbi:MAG: hypothetical protein EXS35_17130 [Pedosphaera sp.]|nr:hypothetical protein [Pedosphaera sp.]